MEKSKSFFSIRDFNDAVHGTLNLVLIWSSDLLLFYLFHTLFFLLFRFASTVFVTRTDVCRHECSKGWWKRRTTSTTTSYYHQPPEFGFKWFRKRENNKHIKKIRNIIWAERYFSIKLKTNRFFSSSLPSLAAVAMVQEMQFWNILNFFRFYTKAFDNKKKMYIHLRVEDLKYGLYSYISHAHMPVYTVRVIKCYRNHSVSYIRIKSSSKWFLKCVCNFALFSTPFFPLYSSRQSKSV